ncbi:MAG: hypothetical protein ACI9N1_000305 [Flavobacteriales bacterium]
MLKTAQENEVALLPGADVLISTITALEEVMTPRVALG